MSDIMTKLPFIMTKPPFIIIGILAVVLTVVVLIIVPGNEPITSTTTFYPGGNQTTAVTTVQQEALGNVSITSSSCTSRVVNTGYNSYKYYDLKVSGTATGPAMTTLGISTNPLAGNRVLTCGSWTFDSYGNCYSGNGGKSGTSWSLSVYNMSGDTVDRYALGNVYVDARENIFNGSSYTHVANSSVTIKCA